MDLLAAEAVVERLERGLVALPSRGAAAIAFDGDGTLWSGDVGDDFFHAVVATGRVLPPAVAAMQAVARAAGLAGGDDVRLGQDSHTHDSGVALARSLFQAYLDHRLAEDVTCEVIAWVCAGWREEEVLSLASDVVTRARLEARRHASLRVVIEWARSVGVETYLVSASPRPIVEAAGAAWGFSRDRVLAVTTLFKDGVMLADVVRPIPYGPGKAALLEGVLAGRALLGAFGDNVFDVPMLQAARVPVVVEPKPRLVAHLAALAHPGEGFASPPVRVRV